MNKSTLTELKQVDKRLADVIRQYNYLRSEITTLKLRKAGLKDKILYHENLDDAKTKTGT